MYVFMDDFYRKHNACTVGVSKLVKIRKKFERKIVNIFLLIGFIFCFGCSKEPSHRDGSFEYPQHMFWLRIKKNSFQLGHAK